MAFKSEIFDVNIKELSELITLHLINIEVIDAKLKQLIEQSIVSIWDGPTSTPIEIVKIQLVEFFKSKRGTDIELGAVAEFFIHLYLNEIGFKQECLYKNLEEGSIKKGFDGYYSLQMEEWIMESKSGSISTAGISHMEKIKESYNDLKAKISGNVKNDPWNNAFSHAKMVGTELSILENIKRLSNDFTLKKFKDINDFNIIPSSTIFLENSWNSIDSEKVINEATQLISRLNFKKINIICVNKKSVELLWDYLNN